MYRISHDLQCYMIFMCAFYFEPLGSEIESSKKDTVLFIASDDIILVPILFFLTE